MGLSRQYVEFSQDVGFRVQCLGFRSLGFGVWSLANGIQVEG